MRSVFERRREGEREREREREREEGRKLKLMGHEFRQNTGTLKLNYYFLPGILK